MGRRESHRAVGGLRPDLRAQAVVGEMERRGLSFLLRRRERRPRHRAGHLARPEGNSGALTAIEIARLPFATPCASSDLETGRACGCER